MTEKESGPEASTKRRKAIANIRRHMDEDGRYTTEYDNKSRQHIWIFTDELWLEKAKHMSPEVSWLVVRLSVRFITRCEVDPIGWTGIGVT
jgi:hypothetical protein